jgi:formylglycine-generating enzyme required for sulfatase activity
MGWTWGGLILGLILGISLGWFFVVLILGIAAGVVGGVFLGKGIAWLLMIPMTKVILPGLILIAAILWYGRLMSKKFLIDNALLERCGKTEKGKYAKRNLLIAGATLAAVLVFYPHLSKAVEQIRENVSESVRLRSKNAMLAEAGFVRIPGGTFTMGSPVGEANRADEEVEHQVTVSPFYMGKHEVTQYEYQIIMESNPSRFKGDGLPVEMVTWFDAITYCNKRSEAEGLNPAYTINGKNVAWDKDANGYRLPTEAEWEYACRGGLAGTFGVPGITTNLANYDGNYVDNGSTKGEFRERTWAVESGASNEWGLYDMHGNVREWCWDWYGKYISTSQTDPSGPDSGTQRILRGGSWYNSARYLRSAYRSSADPATVSNTYGFRLVRQ